MQHSLIPHLSLDVYTYDVYIVCMEGKESESVVQEGMEIRSFEFHKAGDGFKWEA